MRWAERGGRKLVSWTLEAKNFMIIFRLIIINKQTDSRANINSTVDIELSGKISSLKVDEAFFAKASRDIVRVVYATFFSVRRIPVGKEMMTENIASRHFDLEILAF